MKQPIKSNYSVFKPDSPDEYMYQRMWIRYRARHKLWPAIPIGQLARLNPSILTALCHTNQKHKQQSFTS